ncbi:hypothetical protein [Prevotella sp.]|uniref:hypothetical protein n=1 Tax=Prevotella sp. TaxID=59823 RepID=UPI0027E37BB7|nr:hypothetical protein [Prevotella sp.]
MFYKNQIEKIMSEAGFSDSERELFGEVVDIYILNGKGEKALGDERLKDLLSKIEKHGLFEELKNLLSRKIDTSPKDPITGDDVSLAH